MTESIIRSSDLCDALHTPTNKQPVQLESLADPETLPTDTWLLNCNC